MAALEGQQISRPPGQHRRVQFMGPGRHQSPVNIGIHRDHRTLAPRASWSSQQASFSGSPDCRSLARRDSGGVTTWTPAFRKLSAV